MALSALSAIVHPIIAFSDGHYDYDIHGEATAALFCYDIDKIFHDINGQPIHTSPEYVFSSFNLKTLIYLQLESYTFMMSKQNNGMHMCVEFSDEHLILYSFSPKYLETYIKECPNRHTYISFRASPRGTNKAGGHRLLFVIDKYNEEMFLLDSNGIVTINLYEPDDSKFRGDIYLDELLNFYVQSIPGNWKYIQSHKAEITGINYISPFNKLGWCIPATLFIAHLLTILSLDEVKTVLKQCQKEIHPLIAEYIDGLYNKYILSDNST